METIPRQTVLVTGGSGFIATHCIIALLNAGYYVRATLRSMNRAAEVNDMLRTGGATLSDRVSFIEADLYKEEGWMAAVAGCTYVLHIASPTPASDAANEEAFIRPAVNGVLYVLRAAKAAGVKRVVLTSAFGAVGFGAHKTTPYTEEDWTIPTPGVPAYQKSKTLAEKAAWDFIAGKGQGLELSVVNPTGVLGPVLSADYSHSIQLIHRMLNGELSGCPRICSGFVDVRDVANLHLLAMTHAAASGQRFIAVAGKAMFILDIAKILKEHLGAKAAKVPARELPNWLLKIAGWFNPNVRWIVPLLGMVKEASSSKAHNLLGWQPRSNQEAVLATAQSLRTWAWLNSRAF